MAITLNTYWVIERQNADLKITENCSLYVTSQDTVPDCSIIDVYDMKHADFYDRGISGSGSGNISSLHIS